MKRLLALFVVVSGLRSFAQESVQPEAVKTLPALPFKEESIANVTAPGAPPPRPGVVVALDEAFAAQHENQAPNAPFTIVVPTGKGLSFLPGGKKTGNPELLRPVTVTPDKRGIETLCLASLNVPLQPDPADRLKVCAQLLKTQALPSTTKDYKDVRVVEAYATKIGGNDAVCVHAQMTKPGSGERYAVKLAGILHPKQTGAVLASLVADTKLSEIKRPEDLSSKGLGLAIIHSIKFADSSQATAKP